MDPTTAARLGAINAAFYREHADEFSAARERPWSGWRGLPDLLRARGIDRELDVLDVGCGNARFGAFLCAEAIAPRRYVGVDASAELLAHARARRLPGAHYRRADFVASDPETALPPGPFGLVALFGVLHHVPGAERRLALVRALLRRAARGGLLVLAAWQRDACAGPSGRIVGWDEWNRRTREPIDPAALEPGDCLLAWGASGRAVRYCHFVDDAEIDALLAALRGELVATWRADGRDGHENRYLALARRSAEGIAPGGLPEPPDRRSLPGRGGAWGGSLATPARPGSSSRRAASR